MIKGNITELGEKLNAVVWAYNSETRVVEGITATKFKPFNTCSRAQVVSFMWRMKGEPRIEDTGISFYILDT